MYCMLCIMYYVLCININTLASGAPRSIACNSIYTIACWLAGAKNQSRRGLFCVTSQQTTFAISCSTMQKLLFIRNGDRIPSSYKVIWLQTNAINHSNGLLQRVTWRTSNMKQSFAFNSIQSDSKKGNQKEATRKKDMSQDTPIERHTWRDIAIEIETQQ